MPAIDTYHSGHPQHGLLPRRFRALHEQLLVLGPGETVPAIRRLQDSREHSPFGEQPRHGLDGNVLQSRLNGSESR